MRKDILQVGQLIREIGEIDDQIQSMADTIQKENRTRNEQEEAEYRSLQAKKQNLEMRVNLAYSASKRDSNKDNIEDATKMLRDNINAGRKTELRLMSRDLMMVSDVTAGGFIPVNVQDFIEPLNEGFILDKVGLTMPTGLAGDYVWPVYEMVDAQIAGEGVALTDTKIPFSKLQAQPERIGIAVPCTYQSLNQTNGILETIVRKIMPLSIRQLLNKILFSVVKVNGATNLVGPYVGLTDSAVALSATPTFAELNKSMKAAVLETGIDGDHLCWIMTKSMKAVLEGEPINSKGIYIPMIQNNTLCGLPVYTTNCIRNAGTEYIGIGDWRYQPMGLFGSIRFIVDPYSQARKDSVDFVLNCDYGTKTLRPEAFKLGKVTTA
ncbi:MAG: phage major capsid protein [Prevotella sp.]|jgi:HK97 family phage major capsid protein|nr:phage major capsid protein [Prevotella sp.]